MTLFTNGILEYGTEAYTLWNIPISTSNAYGGIRMNLLDDSFEEEYPDRNIDLLETSFYQDIKGKFTLKISGPTSSGVAYFANRITSLMNKANEDIHTQTIPVLLSVNTDQFTLTSFRYSYRKATDIQTLQMALIDIEYTRRPITGFHLTMSTNLGNVPIDRAGTYIISDTTSNRKNSIPSPLSLQMRLLNQKTTIPSGILLTSNQEIITISGYAFYGPTTGLGGTYRGPTQFKQINENNKFPYSVYDTINLGGGVLQYLPTNTTRLVASGWVYGNGYNSPQGQGVSSFTNFSARSDVFMVYRTTVSGSLFKVDLNSFSSLAGTSFTLPQKQLDHNTNPTIAYLGTLETPNYLSQNIITLGLQAVGLISGVLLIDRIILQPLDKYASRSIQVTKLSLPSQNPSSGDSPTYSGKLYLDLQSNYMVDNDFTRQTLLPSIYAYRDDLLAAKTPSYQGNISLFVKPDNVSLGILPGQYQDGPTISFLYVATGSTYDTVSGLSNWTYTNTVNQKTNVNWYYDWIHNPKLLTTG